MTRSIDRIGERATFRTFRGSRERARSGPLQVVRLPREGVDRPAVAYAISRRVGGAVTRNRLRRQLRALAESAAERDLLQPGSYLVIVAPDAAGATSATLSGHLTAALERLDVQRASED